MSLLKKWRMAGVATLATASISILAAAPSFAALPGEDGTWHPQNLPNGQEQAGGSNEEARNNGELVHVWHSNDDRGNLWANFALNNANGAPVHIAADGHEAPVSGNGAVAPYNGSSFQIFFTGTNFHIYRATFAPNSGDPSENNLATMHWFDTGLQSHVAPAAVQIGAGQERVAMVYTALDGSIRYIEWNRGQWVNHFILGGVTNSAPSIAYAPGNNGGPIVVGHTGTDGHGYASASWANNPTTWSGWQPLNGGVVGQTASAATPSGTVVYGSRSPNGDIWFETASVSQSGAEPTVTPHGWVRDAAHWNSPWDVAMSTDDSGNVVANMTGNDTNHVYWKEVFRNGS